MKEKVGEVMIHNCHLVGDVRRNARQRVKEKQTAVSFPQLRSVT